MIVRRLGGFHYVTAQPEHARQSAVLAAAVDERFLPESSDRRALLAATAHHDDGWKAWEANPRFEENGLPVNFTDVLKEEHAAVWRRGVYSALRQHSAAAAAYVARHAKFFMDDHDEDTAIAHGELTEALARRAWNSRPLEAVHQGFSVLFLCDGLSLLAAAGWDRRLDYVLTAPDGSTIDVHAEREGDWTVRVSPWPFLPPRLDRIYIDAIAIPDSDIAQSSMYLKTPREYMVRIPVDYLPG